MKKSTFSDHAEKCRLSTVTAMKTRELRDTSPWAEILLGKNSIAISHFVTPRACTRGKVKARLRPKATVSKFIVSGKTFPINQFSGEIPRKPPTGMQKRKQTYESCR